MTMTMTNIMAASHKIAKEIVLYVGDYKIALSLALKEVWRQVKAYGKKRFGAVAITTAAFRLTTPIYQDSVYGVPSWIIKKNLRQDEADTVLTRSCGMSIVRETGKAELVRFDTDFGGVEMWTPKSILEA